MDMIRVPLSRQPSGPAWDEKGKSNIVQIFISHFSIINSIQFLYADDNGKLVLADVHGTMNGQKVDVVTFEYPSEFLTWVSGGSITYYGERVLSTVTFGTNKGKYGPYGRPGSLAEDFEYQPGPYGRPGSLAEDFEYQLGPHRLFGGFHGSISSDGKYVQAIGVYIKPITLLVENDDTKNASDHKVESEN